MATPLPNLREKNKMYYFKKNAKESGVATSILTILPYGDGEMTTSILLILWWMGGWPPPS